MKKYILTGGPGSGKSSIILALEHAGEYTVREAAEDYIRLRQAQGQKEPWKDADFQEQILRLQMQREARIPQDAKRAFLDRGLLDGLAYAEPGTEAYERIEEEASKARYDGVFLIETLGQTEKTAVRRENHEEAVRLGEKLEQVYKEHGYSPIKVQTGTLEERVKAILENL